MVGTCNTRVRSGRGVPLPNSTQSLSPLGAWAAQTMRLRLHFASERILKSDVYLLEVLGSWLGFPGLGALVVPHLTSLGGVDRARHFLFCSRFGHAPAVESIEPCDVPGWCFFFLPGPFSSIAWLCALRCASVHDRRRTASAVAWFIQEGSWFRFTSAHHLVHFVPAVRCPRKTAKAGRSCCKEAAPACRVLRLSAVALGGRLGCRNLKVVACPPCLKHWRNHRASLPPSHVYRRRGPKTQGDVCFFLSPCFHMTSHHEQ